MSIRYDVFDKSGEFGNDITYAAGTSESICSSFGDWALNRVVASLTLLIGLAAMMMGVYSNEWSIMQQYLRQFVPFFG